jgi:1,4-dihydroxy-2-naphthoate polyprenyltransferase
VKKRIALWWRAVRAYSFPASVVPCLVGAAFAASSGERVDWPFLPLVILCGVALHVGTNLVNDAADFTRGVDGPGSLGGSGVLVAGRLTVRQVWVGAFAALVLAAVCGLPLLWARGWPLVLIGSAGALGGYAYTGPPLALKYRALGEVWVFVFMGVLMVAGSAFAVSGAFAPGLLPASVPVGFLVAAILAANNQRDRRDDALHRVHTLATLLGARGASAVTLLCLGGAYASLPVLVLARVVAWPCLAPLLTLPLAWPLARECAAGGAEHDLAAGTVERVAALHLFFGLAYALGLGAAALLR